MSNNQMTIREVKSDLLGEKYVSLVHPAGLRIWVYPKKDYATAYAVFGTKYGSIDTRFQVSGEEVVEVPEGIAHFLEHKLFESEELDAFTRYAQTGASANAYTSFDRTCYLFSCSDNFDQSLEILLDFVQHPYFTAETVQKEQGIIGQEIRMYDDQPDWRVLFNMLRGMYHNHPVRIDIAGTQQSIAEITDKLLYQCYHAFYNLRNMVLCVAGNVTVEEVLQTADRLLQPSKDQQVERRLAQEPPEVVTPVVEERMSVAAPVFCLGYKEEVEGEEVSLQRKVETSVLLDMLVGEASPLYQRLLEQELINTNFSYEYFTGGGYACILFSGESAHPEKVKQAIEEEAAALRRGDWEKSFERSRKMLYGRSIMSYNNVEGIANSMVAACFSGVSPFDELEVYQRLTRSDLEERLRNSFEEERSVLSVIRPL